MAAKTLVRLAVLLVLVAGMGAAIVWYRGGLGWREAAPETPDYDNAVTGDLTMILPADQIEPKKQQALRGDNLAANDLGDHYHDLGNHAEERRWRGLAAGRGHCRSMDELRELEERSNNRAAAVHWNNELRRHRCVIGQVYISEDPNLNRTPAWNDNY
jgi:hypothetical protein